MCECNLVVERRTDKPIKIERVKHSFTYSGPNRSVHTLLGGLNLEGTIDYAAMHEIKDMYGVKKGYMFVIGERDDEGQLDGEHAL